MRRTEGQPREGDSRFSQSFPHGPGGEFDLEPHRADGPSSDPADGEMSGWEAAWVDLGGEG